MKFRRYKDRIWTTKTTEFRVYTMERTEFGRQREQNLDDGKDEYGLQRGQNLGERKDRM